jgi:hypothetical protein
MTSEQIEEVEQRQQEVLQDHQLLARIARQSLLPAKQGTDSSRVGLASSRGEYIPAEVSEDFRTASEAGLV